MNPAIGQDAALEKRLRSEGVSAWLELAKVAAFATGAIEESREIHFGDDKPARIKRYKSEFKRAGDLLLDEEIHLTADGEAASTVVNAVGSDYSFTLARKPEEPFVISYIGSTRRALLTEKLKQDGAFFYADIPWRLYHWPLGELVGDPAFSLRNIAETDYNGDQCVEFEFTLGPRDPGRDKYTNLLRAGKITVVPARLWCIREYDVRLDFGREEGRAHGVLQYDVNPSAPPVPVLFVEDVENLSRPGNIHKEVKFPRFVLEKPSPEEFTIRAYGFPDDSGFRAKRLNRAALLACLAAIFALLIAIRWKRRLDGSRTRSAKPSSS